MLLRFYIAITKTTKSCPTLVLFSLDVRRMKAQKHLWTNSMCVAFPMNSRSAHVIVASKHWKCNTHGICPNVFVCFHSSNVERTQNRGWTSLRCLGNCNVKTQQHLHKFKMFTPSNVLELHLSTISCRWVETGWNHQKRKANRNCPNGVFDVWENSRNSRVADHPGTTPAGTRKTHDVKLSSVCVESTQKDLVTS